jgi:hypothetical protein
LSIPLGHPDGGLDKAICCILSLAEKLCTHAPKIAQRAIFPTPILQNHPHPTALAPPALKNDNQLSIVTQEDTTGNGGASKGGEGRGGRWRGEGTRGTKPNNDDDKIIALAPPAIKEIIINQDGGRL